MITRLPPLVARLVVLFLVATPLLTLASPLPDAAAAAAPLAARAPQATRRMGQRKAKKAEVPTQKKDYSSFLCPALSVACPVSAVPLEEITLDSAAALEASLNSLADWFKAGFECVELATELNQCGGCLSLAQGQDCAVIANARATGCENGSCTVYSCFEGYTVSPDRKTCVKRGAPSSTSAATPVTPLTPGAQAVLNTVPS
ncbi:hypothetical protein JCM24511_10129 [Saitozyma sp. JCM 24511]|nr:hypothetical protein JCM24511_10129 [Saitozyma sp. JCM 24511]